MIENIFKKANNLNRKIKRLILIIIDSLIILFALNFSLYLRLESIDFIFNIDVWILFLLTVFFSIILYNVSGLYLNITKFISDKIIKNIIITSFFSSLLIPLISYNLELILPRSIPLIYFLLILIGKSYIRFFIRFLYNNYFRVKKENVVIYGSEKDERQLSDLLLLDDHYKPIAFFDDNSELIGNNINGIKILNSKKSINFLKKNNVKTIFVTTRNFSKSKYKIFNLIEDYPLEIKNVPNLKDLIKNNNSLKNLTNVSINELLGREPILPKKKLMEANIKKKILFVSGAGGSIGGELCKQILALEPRKLLLYESSEFALYQIHQELNELIAINKYEVTIIPVLGFIQDKEHLLNVFKTHRINTIFHAAAYKHVTLVEKNPLQAIKNNIFGTQTIAECAITMKINNFTLISTDKAVRPSSFMGASKRIAELIVQSYGISESKTIFSIVRFGNVLDSSGSVIPLFKDQIKKGGPVTVTDQDVVRYFMTKSESAQLVIQASALAKGGEVFLLDMGKPIKIFELAKQMIILAGKLPYFSHNLKRPLSNNEIKIEIIGLKKGEKLFEEMFIGNNYERTTHPRIFSANEVCVTKKELELMMIKLKKIIDTQSIKEFKKVLKIIPINYQN